MRHWNREIRGVVKQPSSEALENRCQGWTGYLCTLSSFQEVKQISSSQNKEQCPRDGVGGTRQREMHCWRVLGVERKVQPGGGSLVWKWSEEGMRQHHWSKWTLWLSVNAESSHGLPATCSLDHIPWGRPHWEVAAFSCFLHCSIPPLHGVPPACHLSVLSWPSSSSKCISFIGSQLVPPRPVLLENCCTGVQEMRAETPVCSAFLGLCFMWLTSVFFRLPSLVTFYCGSCVSIKPFRPFNH